MNQDSRVLIRRGARELNGAELEQVGGGIGTTTLCTLPVGSCKDGDASIGECGPCIGPN